MSPVHLHLLLNHVAVLAAIFSMIILLVGLNLSERVLIRTAMIGFLFSALVCIPVFLTGEPSEEVVEEIPGISRSTIKSHEEAAEVSIWIIGMLGLVSLVSLFAAERFQRFLATVLVVLGVFAVGALAYTALEGGKIRHSEVRDNTTDSGTLFRQEDDND